MPNAPDISSESDLPSAERWSLTLAGLDHLDQGITVIDDQLRLVTCNRRFLELLDFPAQFARPGTHFDEFIRYNVERGEYGPGDPEQLFQERVLLARKFNPHCVERTRPDGTILEIRGNPMAGGGFVTVYTDITERKRTEAELQSSRDQLEERVRERTTELQTLNEQLTCESVAHQRTATALRESETWIRHITDAVPVLIAYVDNNQRYRFANKKHEEWFGVSTDDFIGHQLSKFFSKFVDTEVNEQLQTHMNLALHGEVAECEYQLTSANSKRMMELHTSFIPHFDAQGKVLGIFALSQDLTDYKQAQAALIRAQKMEAVGQLTGGIAHDFNNLLTIIMGNLEFLEGCLEGAGELEDAARTAMDATKRGAELTGSLLAFSRKQRLAPKPVSPYRHVDEISTLLRRTLGASITVEMQVQPSVWWVWVDPNQLFSALLNLALNARDAMPEGGRLTISAGNIVLDEAFTTLHSDIAPGEYVLVSVTDTGIGMSKEVLEHVFEPFYTTKDIGTGLGLSMVYGFIKQSGGHVRIHSDPGLGTTIELYLQRLTDSAAIAATKAVATQADLQGSENVLIVEDDPDVRAYTRRVLTECGYTVQEAADAHKALSVLRSDTAVDLLLTDIAMPGGIDGLELAVQASRLRSDLKVLYMSGYPDKIADSTDRDIVLLKKPFQRPALAQAVRKTLNGN